MKELTVFVFFDNAVPEEEQAVQLKKLEQADERIEAVLVRNISELSSALESAEGRYIKILWNGERIPKVLPDPILEDIEKADADVLITGFREVAPFDATAIEHSPVCSCNNRQIDMIKLSDKYEEIKDCLWSISLCYHRDFLTEVMRKTGEKLLDENTFAILPFIHAESIIIVPDVYCECDSEKIKTPGIAPSTVKGIVDYYESSKPMGKARDEYVSKRISAVVIRQYIYLLTNGPDIRTGRKEAAKFRKDLMENAPHIAKITDRRYRILRRIGHYKMVSRRALNEC